MQGYFRKPKREEQYVQVAPEVSGGEPRYVKAPKVLTEYDKCKLECKRKRDEANRKENIATLREQLAALEAEEAAAEKSRGAAEEIPANDAEVIQAFS
ncbi:hypothetical protein OESDEN_14262 [Oesophagostomum dentatum]|uniref:Uncharacterized protein n=1 Tax=Oesophagostomum dentatum TaxID=61180 RepID=A0A0B1SS02_OESDE|nr:hypothetical protein OESDEN_14262 [Oesophagostomum dentatum]